MTIHDDSRIPPLRIICDMGGIWDIDDICDIVGIGEMGIVGDIGDKG